MGELAGGVWGFPPYPHISAEIADFHPVGFAQSVAIASYVFFLRPAGNDGGFSSAGPGSANNAAISTFSALARIIHEWLTGMGQAADIM